MNIYFWMKTQFEFLIKYLFQQIQRNETFWHPLGSFEMYFKFGMFEELFLINFDFDRFKRKLGKPNNFFYDLDYLKT